MFDFLKKVRVDQEKVHEFCDWFVDNEEKIRRSIECMRDDPNGLQSMLDEVELQLARVYRDGYRGKIEFEYGGKDEDWELHLFHLNNKFLIRATGLIAEELNPRLAGRWVTRTER